MKKKDFILLFILFVFIFQPPFFPVPLIYLIGPIVIIKILKEKRSKNLRTIAKYSNLYKMTRFFLVIFFVISVMIKKVKTFHVPRFLLCLFHIKFVSLH